MKTILASGSPRRREILGKLGVDFKVVVSDKEEIITSNVPEDVVKELSSMKAQAVFDEIKDSEQDDFMVIGADTVVSCDGKILGKPKDAGDAARMLHSLAGRAHEVFTGVTVKIRRNGMNEEVQFAECTKVYVYPMLDSEIVNYIGTGEPMDKAGAYAIQGLFAPYIQRIEGDYYNIVGFPIARIFQELKKIQIFLA